MKTRSVLFTLPLFLLATLAFAQAGPNKRHEDRRAEHGSSVQPGALPFPGPLYYSNRYDRSHEQAASQPYQTDMAYGVSQYRAWAATQPRNTYPPRMVIDRPRQKDGDVRRYENRPQGSLLRDALGHCFQLGNDRFGRETRTEVDRKWCGF